MLTLQTSDVSSWYGASAEAQNQGFHANFDYISGQNSKNMQIPMTSPVIFRKGKPGWQVGFYVPSKFTDIEDIPEPKVRILS